MYAPLPGIDIYFEDHGTGTPLVLLHGGMLTLDLSFGALMPRLTPHRRVIPIELQGHGRTADVERDITLANQAADVVGVLDHLGLERADVLGFSWGGLVALEMAVRRPGRVDRLVLGAVHRRKDDYHDEIHDPSTYATSTRMPTEAEFGAMFAEYERYGLSTFETVVAKLDPIVTAEENWTAADLARVTAPTCGSSAITTSSGSAPPWPCRTRSPTPAWPSCRARSTRRSSSASTWSHPCSRTSWPADREDGAPRTVDHVLRAVATWWDGVELWLTQLDFTVQVVLVVAVVGPVCWGAAAIIDTVVERSVAARLEAQERREQRRAGATTAPEA